MSATPGELRWRKVGPLAWVDSNAVYVIRDWAPRHPNRKPDRYAAYVAYPGARVDELGRTPSFDAARDPAQSYEDGLYSECPRLGEEAA